MATSGLGRSPALAKVAYAPSGSVSRNGSLKVRLGSFDREHRIFAWDIVPAGQVASRHEANQKKENAVLRCACGHRGSSSATGTCEKLSFTFPSSFCNSGRSAYNTGFWQLQNLGEVLFIMGAARVDNRLWDLVEPLLSPPRLKTKGGRPRVPDRACLRGIVFVLRSGIPWEMLPKELGCGSGMTCWRRLRDWQQAGIWDLIHFALLDWLSRCSRIDWSIAVVDSCSIRAVFGGS